MAPLASTRSSSSDYFGSQSDDSSFLEELAKTTFPGDIIDDKNVVVDHDADREEPDEIEEFPPTVPSKRQRSPDSTGNDEMRSPQNELHVYGPARFGDFGQYMRRKRAKLQIQNVDIAGDETLAKELPLFHGISIYINGWTSPSIQDLRQLIIRHGGVFQPYLDKKTIVTHIITCSLTPAKMQEFKHMKVVHPQWLVESSKRGVLLPWQDYIFRPTNRSESSQGVRSTQRTLPIPQPKPQPSTSEQAVPTLAPVLPIPIMDTQEPQSLVKTTNSLPSYAAHNSNPLAQRAMNNPQWRSAHTSLAPDFIEGYYRNSRLHHLSTWKAELKELLREAQEKAESTAALGDGQVVTTLSPDVDVDTATSSERLSMRGADFLLRSPTKSSSTGKGKGKAVSEDRIIMHCDFDCFFVAAGLTKRPHLRGKAVVVCHSQDGQGGNASTSEIASASYEARNFGIKNGMSLQQARKLCPHVVTIPYEFELYKEFSLQFYTALMMHADDLQAVSVDEALIDVSSTVNRLRQKFNETAANISILQPYDPARELAEQIRSQVKKFTGCEISIGISHNIMLARLATRRAKPARSFHLVPAEVDSFLSPMDITDLHSFGNSAKQKALEKWGTSTLGELVDKSKGVLCQVLGKTTGETLYNAIRGIDERKLESDKERKSVSCDINYGIRFENNEQVERFLYQMSKEVARRLNEVKVLGRSITVKVMKRDPTAPVEPPKFLGHGACDVFNKQMALSGPNGRATNDEVVIGEHAWRLLKSFNFDAKELRGLGIQIQKLEPTAGILRNEPDQRKLPFQKVDRLEGSLKDIQRIVEASAAAGIAPAVPVQHGPDLPSFSQVDKSVFEALPHEIKQELESEYKRRSASPFPAAAQPLTRPKTTVQAMFPFPRKTNPFTKTNAVPNVKRITQQLAPRARSSLSPRKHNPFTKLPGLASWKVPESELFKLDIDPEVYAALPRNVQREQITAARMLKTMGYIPQASGKRVILRPREIDPGEVFRRPPPKVCLIEPPTLKQQGERGKLYFTETDDVQRVIEQWVHRFQRFPPNEKDVQFFAKWLVRSVDRAQATDEGLYRAVAVVKWWLVLLKRFWGRYEYGYDEDDPDEEKEGKIGDAWWDAFRDVKGQMDEVAKKRFGGKLSLR